MVEDSHVPANGVETPSSRPLLSTEYMSHAYQRKSTETPAETDRFFDSTRQLSRLTSKQALRWLVTVMFAVFIIVTLKIYGRKGNFSSREKTIFNTIATALALGLGLNIFVGLLLNAKDVNVQTLMLRLCRSLLKNLRESSDGDFWLKRSTQREKPTLSWASVTFRACAFLLGSLFTSQRY